MTVGRKWGWCGLWQEVRESWFSLAVRQTKTDAKVTFNYSLSELLCSPSPTFRVLLIENLWYTLCQFRHFHTIDKLENLKYENNDIFRNNFFFVLVLVLVQTSSKYLLMFNQNYCSLNSKKIGDRFFSNDNLMTKMEKL